MNLEIPFSLDVAAVSADSVPTRRSLLSRLRDLGDDASWRLFFDTYWRLIYNVARKAGLSDSDAQDVVQETIIAVARKLPEFRYDPSKGSFKQWLLLITRRRIHDHLRRYYRAAPFLVSAEERAGSLENTPSFTRRPDEEIDAAWESEWRETLLQAALARVRQSCSPKQFQVFDYCVLQNVPAREVGRMLGLSAPQVYLAKHRVGMAVKRSVAELEQGINRSPGF
jgi:RNA polymerase sigma-70 factor (ECF subfamily)